MSNLGQAVWVEFLKARCSRMPLFTTLGFAMLPLTGGFFMIILKNPDLARRVGLISAKAQFTMGTADWQTYLNFLAQAIAIGGIVLFGLIGSWMFGREYSDHTVKDLLALPTSRSAIVFAKFIVIVLWTTVLTLMIIVIALAVGAAVALPPTSPQIILHGISTLLIAFCLTIPLITPITFFASAGHGYLPPIGIMFLAIFLAQVIAIIGYGEYFPWSIPALYSQGASLSAISFVIVILTSIIGMSATFVWWEMADQTF